ncbi:Protein DETOXIFICATION 12 [Glycine soja]
MEESLVKKHEEDRVVRWGVYSEEMRRICEIAGPMVAVVSSQYLLQVVSTMIVGHLGELYLSSAALAISLSGVTGFSLHMGMASGLETICGQAYGAQQYQRIGMQTYTAIFSLILVSIPVSILWINMESILVFIGQDPLISHEAGKFTIWLVPALFAYAILQPLVRYFQVQSLLLPMFASSCVTLIIHVPLCWALVFKTRLSNVGGALAVSISIWSNVIFLGLYMRYSSACAKTRAPISMELFKGMWEFFRFAIPSAVMGCYQIHNLKLQFYLLNTISTLYMIPFGIGAAASTRVSNELGAGNSHAARVAVLAAMSLAVIETSIVSATLFACRNVYGYIFSNEKEVIDYVTVMAPLVCISIILDSIQGVLTGIARGCGWQHLGVFVNLGAFYLCGIPMAALLAFLVRLGGQGLWIGIQSGAFVQTLLLSIITGCINWEKQAIKARKRLFDDQFSADNILDSEPENPSASAITWTVFSQEMKRVGYLAAPMITVTLSQYFLQIISMMMVGHLGKLALSSTAIAISLCAVSGFSLIFGMSCALETQCGQAYGAQQYRKFGVQIYTAIVSLTLACLPLTLFWVYLEKILIFLGQDPSISQEAGKFALCMIPALFAYATLQALIRFFLMQSLISPLVISSSITLCFHVAFSWLMVFKSGFGNLGAAFSIGTSYWLNVILLGLYMKFSTECERTRVPISMELFHGIGEFFTYAIPSAGMSLKLQSYPYVTTTIYTIPEAIGSAASTRVSNALGAGSPQSAQLSVSAAMTLAASAAILVSSIIFACRQVVGYVFSSELDVVDYFTDMVPLLCLSVILDTLHGTLSGIARGCGWQHLGAYVNLGAYYVVGIPIAAMLGFWVQLRGKGLWIGILTGAFCQTVMLSLITSCTNWEKQAIKARERTFQRSFAVEDGLVLTNGEDSLNLSACLVGIGKSSNFGGTKDQNLELEEGKVLITRQV